LEVEQLQGAAVYKPPLCSSAIWKSPLLGPNSALEFRNFFLHLSLEISPRRFLNRAPLGNYGLLVSLTLLARPRVYIAR
jgi:hypothetical protein